jgi:activator of HSP90 ATPase
MSFDHVTRRAFSARLASLVAFGPAAARAVARVTGPDQVSRTAEAIHQEVVLSATRHRVYEALTDEKRFTALMAFSTVPKAPPAEIAREAGGAFTLFDGHIVGRHVELVPDQRIVQVWRAANWDAGMYSIARFQLEGDGPTTTIVFDHTGFPTGQGQHLAEGWYANYWNPLKKYLA